MDLLYDAYRDTSSRRAGRCVIIPDLISRRWVLASPKPWHGLGNRMRSVMGSRALARQHRREFAYCWPLGKHFGARLTDLWNVEDPEIPSPVSRALALRYPFRDESLTWIPAAQNQRLWQIRTAHALAFPAGVSAWEGELQDLSPADDIASRISDFRQRLLGAEPYIGVMVRTHAISHQETLAASPLDWYVERLRRLRRDHPDTRFFISADTEDGFAEISSSVPGCVGQTDKGAYNSRPALEASVADLYLLAGSVHLIGAHYSSFPELAQRLAGPDLSLETAATGTLLDTTALPLSRPVDPLRPHIRIPTVLS